MTTIRELLFADGGAGATALKVEEAAERLVGVGALPPRQEATPLSIARGVMTRVAELLNLDVSDVIVGAWRTRSALLAAARESLRQPDTYRQVTVQTYGFGWDHEVDVDVRLNGSSIGTVTFVVTVEVEITALAAIVHNGHISKVSAGDGTVTAALRAAGATPVEGSVQLAHGQRQFDLRYELTLPGHGIPLVDGAVQR